MSVVVASQVGVASQIPDNARVVQGGFINLFTGGMTELQTGGQDRESVSRGRALLPLLRDQHS
jgi:hypothetical protein